MIFDQNIIPIFFSFLLSIFFLLFFLKKKKKKIKKSFIQVLQRHHFDHKKSLVLLNVLEKNFLILIAGERMQLYPYDEEKDFSKILLQEEKPLEEFSSSFSKNNHKWFQS